MLNQLISPFSSGQIENLRRKHKAWLLSIIILLALWVFNPPQAMNSSVFLVKSLLHIAPYLLLSILVAAYATASGADAVIARAFRGSPFFMIALAAMIGAISPFCSCGVIPLIAALLTMGVPLYAIMAFWLASPIMDPSMFVLTSGMLGLEFAIGKTIAAFAIGLFGGLLTLGIVRSGQLTNPLRPGIGDGGCGAASVRENRPVYWKFWQDPERSGKFLREALSVTMFLLKWLVLAYLLESLMLAYIPADMVTNTLGGHGTGPILWATLIGVPAYLNGYAALPLISGLIDQGMAPGAGMAFLVAGGISSIPAAMAVWAMVRGWVFAIYIGIALVGSFITGLLFQFYMM